MEKVSDGKYLLDEVDKKIIKILSANARTSTRVLGQALNLSLSGVKYRLERLSDTGVIRGYVVNVDWDKVVDL